MAEADDLFLSNEMAAALGLPRGSTMGRAQLEKVIRTHTKPTPYAASTIAGKGLTFPTIHGNGTSAEALTGALETASNALRVAAKALDETAPNGRDYYPQGPDAINKAGKEHRARADCIKRVQDELMAIWEHIANLEE